MAKDGKEKHCPCSPKDGKKKCCQPKLKPQKHLAQKNQKSSQISERLFIPVSLLFSPFLFFQPDLKDCDSSSASVESKPPDKEVPIFLLLQNFRC